MDNKSNNLFSSAINKVKQSAKNPLKITSKLYSSQIEEEIDFSVETKNLYSNSPYEVSKLRSTVNLNDPIKAGNSQTLKYEEAKTPYSTNIKTINFHKTEIVKPNKILFKKNKILDEIIVKKNNTTIVNNSILNENNEWKHDLYEADNKKKSLNIVHNNGSFLTFVRNVPKYFTKSKILEFFSKYGQIIGLNLERDTAEIYFTRKDNAIKAAKEANGTEIFGKQIKVTFYETNENNSSINNEGRTNNFNVNPSSEFIININKKDSIWDRIKLKNNN